MENVEYQFKDGVLIISLAGRVDSSNAPRVEEIVKAAVAQYSTDHVVLDCDDLDYLSSAGLRVVLRLAKLSGNFEIINVPSAVYEVFDMTGFTEMFPITKAYRRISLDGCEVIGRGANGTVYRIDPETIVKVYHGNDSLPEINHDRELARRAFVLGVPTAIPYDVVRVGSSYGSVYELLNAEPLSTLLASGEKTVDEVAHLTVDLLKVIHGTKVNPGDLPSEREVVLDWADFLLDYLPKELGTKLHDLVAEVPDDPHMLHGDFHVKNIMYQDGEVLLIDMDTICYGHPIFEFASIYNAYVGFGETDPTITEKFLGIPYSMANELWDKTLHLYFEGADEATIRSIVDKATIVGSARIMRRTIRRNGDPVVIAAARAHLEELVPQVDSLLF